jgi:hypothetical protein
VAADQVDQAACRRAPPGLFGQIGLVRHAAVQLGEPLALGQPRLVDRPAVAAGEQVAVPAGFVVRRRHELRRQGSGAAREAELERSTADTARVLGH